MIDAGRLNTLEDCLVNALQKVRRVREVTNSARKFTENRDVFPGDLILSAEGAQRHAETMLLGALDELTDENDNLSKHRQRNAP